MIRIIKWLVIFFFLFGIMLGVLAVNSIDEYAIVNQPARLDSIELKRVKRFIKLNNPSKLKSGQIANSKINQKDLNLVINYLSQKSPGALNNRINSMILLESNLAYIQSSLRLPKNPAGSYINITAEIETLNNAKTGGSLKLKSLSVGKMTLPAVLANPIAMYLHRQLKNKLSEYNLISQTLQSVNFEKNSLTVNYLWDKQTADTIKNSLSSRVISDDLKRALIAQSNNLSKISYKIGVRASLNEVLRPMFRLAESRSLLNNPIVENKAVFIVLGSYSLNKNLTRLFNTEDQKPIRIKKLYLKNRFDLSKHLLVSAAITSMADSSMAESIGLEKEVSDSQGGSGFSFADLAADHTGIKLAKYATKNEQQARTIQSKLASIKHENEYMPAIDNLPEGLTENEFNKTYDNTAYETMQNIIKVRIANLAIYK